MNKKQQINNTNTSKIDAFYNYNFNIDQNNNLTEDLSKFNKLYDDCKQELYNKAELLVLEEIRSNNNSTVPLVNTIISAIITLFIGLLCTIIGTGVGLAFAIMFVSMLISFTITSIITPNHNGILPNVEEIKHYTEYFYKDLLEKSEIQKHYNNVISSINEKVITTPEENCLDHNIELSKNKVYKKIY